MTEIPQWVQDTINKIVSAQNGELFSCPKCGGSGFHQYDSPFLLLQADPGQPVDVRRGIWVFVQACTTCGVHGEPLAASDGGLAARLSRTRRSPTRRRSLRPCRPPRRGRIVTAQRAKRLSTVTDQQDQPKRPRGRPATRRWPDPIPASPGGRGAGHIGGTAEAGGRVALRARAPGGAGAAAGEGRGVTPRGRAVYRLSGPLSRGRGG